MARISDMDYFSKIVFASMIGFAVVSFWRGAWGLMDIYVFPDDLELSFWVSLAGGLIVLGLTHYATKELM